MGYRLTRATCQGKGAKFPLFSKIDVNGPNAHPLYQKLKKEAGNKTLMSMFGEQACLFCRRVPRPPLFPQINLTDEASRIQSTRFSLIACGVRTSAAQGWVSGMT